MITHWTKKDGTEIAISKMTTPHLINALNLLRRKLNTKRREFDEAASYDPTQDDETPEGDHATVQWLCNLRKTSETLTDTARALQDELNHRNEIKLINSLDIT